MSMLHRELPYLISKKNLVFFSSEKITLSGWMKQYGEEGPSSRFFCDGVHPALITCQTWAEDLVAFIDPIVGNQGV